MFAIGDDGNPYWWYRGSGSAYQWTRFPGTPDGQVVQAVMGSGAWAALTADGTVYSYFGSGPHAGGVLKPIPSNPPTITTIGLHEQGTYLIAAGAPTSTC